MTMAVGLILGPQSIRIYNKQSRAILPSNPQSPTAHPHSRKLTHTLVIFAAFGSFLVERDRQEP